MKYVTLIKPDNDIILQGNRYITSVSELYKVLTYDDTTEIELTKEFVDEYFTRSGVEDFIENAQTINKNVIINVNGILSMFDDNIVQDLRDISSTEELIYKLMQKPKDTLEAIKDIADYYLTSLGETLVANNKVATLHLHNSQLIEEIKALKKDKEEITAVKNEYDMKLNSLINRINFKYEKDVKQNELMQITGHKYTKVLYFKEYSRIHYTDTLLYYLQEILRTMYSMPARFIVVEPFYAYGRAAMYPRCKPYYNLSYNDMFGEDIFLAGYQPRVFKHLMNNPSHVSYCIVLDRSGCDYPFLIGDKIETINICSDTQDIEHKNFRSSDILSYSTSTLNIPDVAGFQVMSTEERMSQYSSMDVIKKLIDRIER